jgi:predicted membrane channel-forming protein YqfA (hemolysin III family)
VSVYVCARADGVTALIAATYTTFNVNVLHIKTWVVGLASALVLAGVIPRVKLYKFGLKPAAP